MAAFSAAGSIFPCAGIERRSPPNSNKALNAARSISGGTITSIPCPFNDVSIAVCCLDLMARVMVNTIACRIGRPRASSSSCTSAIALYADCRIKGRRAHWREHQVRLRDCARHQPRSDTLEINDDNPAVGILLLNRPYNLRFAHVRFDRNARRKWRAIGPDRDRAVRIAIEDHDLRSGIGQLGSQDDRSGRLPGPALGRRDSNYGHLLTRFVRKPDLAPNRMDEKSGLRRISDFPVNLVLRHTRLLCQPRYAKLPGFSHHRSGLMNYRVCMITWRFKLSGNVNNPGYANGLHECSGLPRRFATATEMESCELRLQGVPHYPVSVIGIPGKPINPISPKSQHLKEGLKGRRRRGGRSKATVR